MNKILLGCVILLLGMCLWYAFRRDFYDVAPGRSITVWKTLGGRCYLIPGKYWSPWRPNQGYIQTRNGTWACGVVLNQAADTLFYMEHGTDFIINNTSEGIFIADWSNDQARLDSLYTENKAFRSGVNFLTFCIHDGYAIGEREKLP